MPRWPPLRRAPWRRHRGGVRTLQAALYDSLLDGVILVRHERVAFANAAAVRLLAGAGAQSLIGVPIERLVDAQALARIRTLRMNGRARSGSAPIEADCRTLDGAVKVAELSISTARLDARQAVQVLIRDLSEARLQQTLLQQEKGALELIAKGEGLEAVLSQLCLTVERNLPGGRCAVMLPDATGTTLMPVAAPSLPAEYLEATRCVPIGPMAGSCGTAAWRDEPVIVEHIEQDARWADWRAAAAKGGVAACWSVPFHRPDGSVGGTLAIYYDTPTKPSAAELRLATTFAHLAEVALHQHVARIALNRSELRYQAVLEAVGAAVLVFDADGRVQTANACAVELLGHSEQALLRMTEGELFATATDTKEVPLRAGDRPVPRCFATRLPQRQEVLQLTTGCGAHKWFNVNVRLMPADTAASRDLVVCSMTDVTAMKQAQERLIEVAERDDLTGLANREYLNRYIEAALDKAARKGDHLAMLVIDLNGFKHVNDSLGHTAGDVLLVEVARRLQAAHRARDLLARRSGDEFVAVLHGADAPGDLEACAERIADSLRPAFTIQGHEVFVSASIGAARYPEDASNSDELFRRADAAMYEAKRQGSTGLVLHGHDARQQQVNRLALEAQLRRGLERDEFVLYFQPRYSTTTLEPVAAEALIRWDHPRRGLVAPAEFIGLAEETGFIVELGDWVLRQACQQAMLMQRSARAPIRMSVNISARQFSQTLFAKTIPAIAAQTGLDLRLLELEITETTMMRDSDRDALDALDALRAQGMRVVVDDFGTGYSSLSYLQRFPLDALKIDRSFVQRIPEAADACAIVQAVVSMAKALRLAVVAEGVETDAQRDFMRELGCDELQGFLLCKPVPADMLSQLLDAA